MTRRRIAITAMLLLFAFSLDAQITQQTLIQPTPQTAQHLTKVLEEYREKKDARGEALTLLQLGIAEAGLGNVSGARSHLADAAGKMRAQNDPLGAWFALITLSQIESALSRPTEAIAHVEKALAVLNEAKVSTTPFSVKTLLAFGSVSGFPPEMLQMFDDPGAGKLRSMMIQFSCEPMTHDQYGSLLTQAGQLEKAETELKAAAAGAIYSQGMYDFSIESHFGDLFFRKQQYDDARAHYMKALNASSKTSSMLPTGGEQLITAGIYERLARLETTTGHPEEAKRWSEKMRALGRKRTDSR
jgi:tetratricopeptide (TPR) repeat protein